MFRSQLLKHTARAARASTKAASSRTLPALSSRPIHSTASLREKLDDPPHEGSFARTDSSVHVEYPEEHDLPSSKPVQGRGGLHFKRTLASFSLEGRVGVVTGGARGLGLVMSQAMVISGADIAIVDMNSMCLQQMSSWCCANNATEEEAEKQAGELVASFKRENPGAEK